MLSVVAAFAWPSEGWAVTRSLTVARKTQRALTYRVLIGDGSGISQPAVSHQLRYPPDLEPVRPEELLDAAAPVLKALAAEYGYRRLAAFDSVARGEACQDSDIDLLVDVPPDMSSFEFIRFKQMNEKVLGREIDLISYGGLKPKMDDDIRRDAVLL